MNLPPHQPPMPAAARRAGFAAYRQSFRRRNPGWDVVGVEEKRTDGVAPSLTRKVLRSFPAPEDASPRGSRIDIPASASRAPNDHGVNSARKDRSPLSKRKRQVVIPK